MITYKVIPLILAISISNPLYAFKCPNSKDQWYKWRQTKVMEMLLSRSFTENRSIYNQIRFCKKSFEEHGSCLTNLKNFSMHSYFSSTISHSFGSLITDDKYLKSSETIKFTQLPKDLQDSSFLEHLDQPGIDGIDQALAYIHALNTHRAADKKILAFFFMSANLGSPDPAATRGRFFVYYPDKMHDLFLQFAIQTDPSKPLGSIISVIALQHTSQGNTVLAAPLAYYNDLWRIRDKGTESSYKIAVRKTQDGSSDNCYYCHKSALIPIYPDEAFFDRKRFGDTLADVNRIMSSYAHAHSVLWDVSHYGPKLGAINPPSRTDAFIRSCADTLIDTAESFHKVKNAMNCSYCHNGKQRGQLNFPFGFPFLDQGSRSLLEEVVVHKAVMPLGSELSLNERKAVVSCLMAEYYGFDFKGARLNQRPGDLISWLLEDNCEAP